VERLVKAYFDPQSGFAAATFNTFGESDPNAIGRDDLLALNCLDERISPRAIREFLSATGQDRLREALSSIPQDVDLRDADQRLFADAEVAWNLLQEFDRVGPVIAGKLLARKRPRLVPIVDGVVRTVIDAGRGNYWKTYQAFMADPAQANRLDEISRSASVPEKITLLRVLDVCVWMRGSGARDAYTVRDECNIPDLPWARRP
jgi:hypothetical protein